MKRIRSIVLSWDFIVAVVVLCSSLAFLPKLIPLDVIYDVYSIYITILTVTFSLYFAACAIIITSNDDGFLIFLEDDKLFTDIIWTYKATLVITFITLIISLIDYIITRSLMKMGYTHQNYIFVVINTGLFFYSTCAIFNSMKDSVKFVERRVKFLKNRKKQKRQP